MGMGGGFAVLSLDLADSRGTTIQAMWVHTLSHGPNRLGTTMVVSHIESTNKSWKRLVHEKQKQKQTHNPFLLPNELVIESEQTH
jgi:hypothetical protein